MTASRRFILLLCCLLLGLSASVLVAGCSGDVDDDDSAGDDDDDDTTDDDDDSSAGADLSGNVTRSIDPVEGQDAVGELYVTVFSETPSGESAENIVAEVHIPSVDLSATGAAVAYEATGLTPRKAPYFVVAFLDDDASSPIGGPNENDLRSDLHSVVVESMDSVVFDIDLNASGAP